MIIYGCDNLSDTRVVIDITKGNIGYDEVAKWRKLYNSPMVCVITESQWEGNGFVNYPCDVAAFLAGAS